MVSTGPKRQYVRGITAAFEELFLEPDNTTPLVPIDKDHPQVRIEDPTGFILSTGVGSLLGDGRWRFTWFVPVDTMITDCDDFYKVTWVFLTPGGQQVERTLEFQVIDQVDINPTERAYTYLTMQGETERVFLRFRCPPEDLSLRLIAPDCSEQTYANINAFTQRSDQGGTVFFVDTPELTSTGVYLAVWQSRDTAIAAKVTSVQQLRVPEGIFFYLAPSLRMALDKAQKKIGLAQAYSDPDMYEYLVRGVDMINAENPISSWNLNNVPSQYGMHSYLLLEAMVWGLRAQFISEGELAFSFGGQTVTLDVDRTSTYESMISGIQDYLAANLQKTKRNMLRRGSVGHFAGRPYDFGLTSLVTKVQSIGGGQQQLLPLLSRLGII